MLKRFVLSALVVVLSSACSDEQIGSHPEISI